MGVLQTSSNAVKRIMLDDTDYIEVRADISKREFNEIAAAMPSAPTDSNELSLADATQFQKFLFDMLVMGWSLSDGKPTVEAYESLTATAATAVDDAVASHFEVLMPTSAEGKSPST